jgi:hypothetical protein
LKNKIPAGSPLLHWLNAFNPPSRVLDISLITTILPPGISVPKPIDKGYIKKNEKNEGKGR